MKPKTFVMIALAAVASGIAAAVVYSTNNQWDQGQIGGEALVPGLATGKAFNAVVVSRGGKTLTLESRPNNEWVIKERSEYPANGDKIRALLVKLALAQLVEAKTRMPDRHALLELEDPSAKDAKSRSLKILSGSDVLADLVIGKRRWEAFGSGKSGTYVRKAGEAQTWLANAELDFNADVRSWIEPTIFETDSSKIQSLTIDIPGEETLRVERNASENKVEFVGLPEDAKLKDTAAADALLRAAASIDADDVRKLEGEPSGELNTVAFTTSDGLKVTLRVRKEGDDYWLSIAASGNDNAKATADDIRSKTGGWEYKISSTKAGALLKRRADLIESS